MTTIAFVGDCTTTTALAIAAGWPQQSEHPGRSAILVEADPRGGSLAAWLDAPATPSISTAVTALHQVGASHHPVASHWATLEPLVQQSAAGPRFLPAPFRSREARTAVSEGGRSLLPLLASLDHTMALLDTGAIDLGHSVPSLRGAALVIVCHRQDASSAAAAAARLERLAEHVESLTAAGHRPAIALIGDTPFPSDEIVEFAAPGAASWLLPVDPLASAVLAGRSGVSPRRLARLPLMRAAAVIAADLDRIVRSDDRSADQPADVIAGDIR